MRFNSISLAYKAIVRVTDYYAILRVRDDATAEEIKTAYRRMALRLHPDRNDATDAMAKFLEVQQAYEVLCDPVRKRQYDLKRMLEQSIPGLLEELQRDLLSNSIAIVISRTLVKAGEPFSITLRCPRRVDYLKVHGLEHFEIVQSVEHEMWVNDTTITEAHFVLKAIEQGSFQLGPARAASGNMEYASRALTIQVQGEYRRPLPNFMERAQPVMMWLLVIALPAFIVYNVATNGVKVPEERQHYVPTYGEPEMNRLTNGSQPYPNQVFNDSLMSPDAFGQITVQNKRPDDAVFMIVDNRNYIVYRAYYVRGGSQIVARKIPAGRYSFFAASGSDWAPQKWLGQYKLVGSFKFGEHFDEISEGGIYFNFSQDTVGGQIFYTNYTLELLNVSLPKPYKLTHDTSYFDL